MNPWHTFGGLVALTAGSSEPLIVCSVKNPATFLVGAVGMSPPAPCFPTHPESAAHTATRPIQLDSSRRVLMRPFIYQAAETDERGRRGSRPIRHLPDTEFRSPGALPIRDRPSSRSRRGRCACT